MCLIAYAADGQPITRETLDCADLANPDGIGVMSSAGFAKFLGPDRRRKAWRYLERRVFPAAAPYAVHFRWTTHGENTRSNTHPHVSPDGAYLVMHNGVMREYDDPTGKRSDTSLFVEQWFRDAPPMDAPEWQAFVAVVERYIGSGNKLCVMEADTGRFEVFNQHCGDVGKDGVWYSNTYSLPSTVDPYYRPRTVTQYAVKWWRKYVDDNYPATDSAKARKEAEEEERLQTWLRENRARLSASGPAAFDEYTSDDAYTPARLRREERDAEGAYLYAPR